MLPRARIFAPMEFGRFFLPGPSEVREEVLQAMVRPMIPHRGPDCAELFQSLQPQLKALFGTDREVFVGTCSATAMMEAGVRALPSGRVLALVNGAFSERFAAIAAECGHVVDRMEVPWGQVHDPTAVAERAVGYVGVTVVHSETSTGALQPIAQLAAAVAESPLLVDTVSSLGGVPVKVDARGLGYACSGSQKALAVPPGLSFSVASDALLESASRAPSRGLYLDLLRYRGRQPPYTPALPILYALQYQLERVKEEGLVARFGRHEVMSRRTQDWVKGTGILKVLAPKGNRSPTVTCIQLPERIKGPDLVERIRARGYVVGYGYGKLRGSTFRIGHMGDQTPETLKGLLAACDAALQELD